MAEGNSLWISPELDKGLDRVREILADTAQHSSPLIAGSISSLIEGGGKMLRPALVLLSGWYGKENQDDLYQLAAAVELLHLATLVHDDILDEAATRRGRTTLHISTGVKTALLLGDYLFARSFGLMEDLIEKTSGIRFSRAVERICEGEINQNHDQYSLSASMRRYKRKIAAKTAALIGASLYLGASHSGCSPEEIQQFRRYGYNIGIAFQIKDDLLDLKGSEISTGKPLARDIKNGIFTAPVIYTLRGSAGDELKQILSTPPYQDETLKKAAETIEAAGGIVLAGELAQNYTRRAVNEASGLREGLTRNLLLELTGNLLVRSS